MILRDPVEFEEIVIPEQLTTINVCANIGAREIYKKISDDYKRVGRGNRIFLSRIEPYGRVSNIPEVEEVFKSLTRIASATPYP